MRLTYNKPLDCQFTYFLYLKNMTSNKSQKSFFSWFDLIMGLILLTLLVGGLLTGFYVYSSVRTFVAESKLVSFPVINIGPDGTLPRVADPTLKPNETPTDNEPSITPDPFVTPKSTPDGTPIAEGEDRAPTSTPITFVGPGVKETAVASDPVPPSAATERLTVLVMGIDRREDEQQGPWRTDSMILISIDPQSDSIAILSTPRDLFVTIPNYGHGEYRDRINTAFYYGDLTEYPGGGPALAMQTIRRNFGIVVDRHLVIDFNGFQRIINALGGIEVDVPKQIIDTRYPTEDDGYMTIRFNPGLQTMTGERALIYSRTRKSTSDFDRAARQQQVIMAIRNRVLSLDLIASLTPTTLSELILALEDSIRTDITLDEVLSLAQVANRVKDKNIKRMVIDPNMVSNYITHQGARVLLPNWDVILPLTEETLGIPLLAIAPHPYIAPTWTPAPIQKAAPLTFNTPVTQSTLTPVSNNNNNTNNNDNNNTTNNNRVLSTPTVGTGTPWPTFTPNNGTPWPTFTIGAGTPWPTFTPGTTPSATFMARESTPWPTFTIGAGTSWPTFTPENGTSWPTFTPENGTSWPTFTPENGTPEPTYDTEENYLTPVPTYDTEENYLTPEPTYVTEEPTPDNTTYEEPTPIPEDSSYEPTTVIEDLATEPTPVLEELSYESTRTLEPATYEQTPTPEQP